MYRLKYAHRPLAVGKDSLIIGGVSYGSSRKVRDSDGRIKAILTRLDGTRTLEQIYFELEGSFPSLSYQFVEELVSTLADFGFLEESEYPSELDTRFELWSRAQNLYQGMDNQLREHPWYVQEKLSNSAAAIVGLGGVGSEVAVLLARAGIGKLVLIDPDTVEPTNIVRQHFKFTNIGDAKSKALASQIAEIGLETEIDCLQKSLCTTSDFERTLNSVDTFALSADYPERIRFTANDFALRHEMPWAHCGYQGPEIILGIHDSCGACFRCIKDYQTIERADRDLHIREYSRPLRQAGNSVSSSISAAFLAHGIISLLTGVPCIKTNVEYWFSMQSMTINKVEVPNFETCAHKGVGVVALEK